MNFDLLLSPQTSGTWIHSLKMTLARDLETRLKSNLFIRTWRWTFGIGIMGKDHMQKAKNEDKTFGKGRIGGGWFWNNPGDRGDYCGINQNDRDIMKRWLKIKLKAIENLSNLEFQGSFGIPGRPIWCQDAHLGAHWGSSWRRDGQSWGQDGAMWTPKMAFPRQ